SFCPKRNSGCWTRRTWRTAPRRVGRVNSDNTSASTADNLSRNVPQVLDAMVELPLGVVDRVLDAAVLERPVHEDGVQSDFAGGPQIVGMRRDHRGPEGIDAQIPAGALVQETFGFEGAEQFG